MPNMNFSSRVLGIFDAFSTDYESMTQLMKDLARGRDIYDAESDRVVSKAEAEAAFLGYHQPQRLALLFLQVVAHQIRGGREVAAGELRLERLFVMHVPRRADVVERTGRRRREVDAVVG